MTVGPLFSRIAWSEWMPTTRAFPNRRAWSMAPAWPNSYSSLQLAGCYQSRSQWVLFTVVAKVKAPVNPDAILRDGNIFLRIHWPLARQGNLLVERCCIHWGFLDLKECLERRKKIDGEFGELELLYGMEIRWPEDQEGGGARSGTTSSPVSSFSSFSSKEARFSPETLSRTTFYSSPPFRAPLSIRSLRT